MARLIAVGFWADYAHPCWPDPHELVDHDYGVSERQDVAGYLERGDVVEVYRGWSWCRICGYDRNGHADLSDGTYLWPEGLAHYVREHHLRLPGKFTAHVASRRAGPPGTAAAGKRADLRTAGTDEDWWTGEFSSGTWLVRLVAEDGAPPVSMDRWPEVTALILELQPARSAWPEGVPPRGIRIASCGGTEVAPGLLADVGRLAGTVLRNAPGEVSDRQ
jgi:hypothetical protein